MDLLARTPLISICGRHDTTGHGRVEILGVALLPAVWKQLLVPLSSHYGGRSAQSRLRADWDIHVLSSFCHTTLTLHHPHLTSPSPYTTIMVSPIIFFFSTSRLYFFFFGFSTITHVIEICQPQMVFDMSEVGRPSNQAVSGNINRMFLCDVRTCQNSVTCRT